MESDYTKFVRSDSPLLGDVISVHLLIENYLRLAVARKLERPTALLTDQGPSFSDLVGVAEAIGVLSPDMSRVVRAVNAVRNRYAHRLGFEASRDQIDALLKALREVDTPFLSSFVPGSERELGIALASLAGWFQREFGRLGDA